MTDELDPIDLSELDPARQPERWAARMESTRLAVAAVLRGRRADPLEIVAGWARPILAAAAAVVVLLRAASGVLGPHRPARVDEARRLAVLTEAAVTGGHLPTGAELRAALDGRVQP